jgi:CSLREA domain-containing protein
VRRVRLFLTPLVLLAALTALPAAAGAATTYRVTRTDDAPGPCTTNNCSLRAAVDAVNAGPGGDTIVLPAGSYGIGGRLGISKDVLISGAGARSTTIAATTTNYGLLGIEAAVTIEGVHLKGAYTASGGGAAAIPAGRRLNLRGVVVSDNRTLLDSGGVTAHGGAFEVRGVLDLVDSLLTRNISTGYPWGDRSGAGGAISTRNGGVTTITNSTIAGNTTEGSGAGGSGRGGGIYTEAGGTTAIVNSTLAGNRASSLSGADARGGNIYSAGTTTLRNTILASGDAAQSTENCAGGGESSLGYNLADTTECALGGATDREGLSPGLGALADNGGPTDTMAIASSSPAFDAAPVPGCPATDQRGVTRPQGAGCDIGAFELGVAVVIPPPGVDPPELTALTVSPSTFTLGNFLPVVSQRRRAGTRIAFILSEPARVRLAFSRRASGRRVRGRCVKPTRRNRGRRRCRRTVTVAMAPRQLGAGAHRIRFSGRLSRRRKLKPGRYTLSVTAVDRDGLGSAPARARVRAVRPPRR